MAFGKKTTARFSIRGSDETGPAFRSAQMGMKSLGKSAGQLGSMLGKLTGVGVGVGAISAMIRSSVQMSAQLVDNSKKLGLNIEWLQSFQFAARQAGIRTTTTNMALQRFTRRVGEAARGTGELKGTLDALGISTTTADGAIRPIEEVLGEFADAISSVESQAEKLKIAFKGFDSEGPALVAVLQDGSGAMDGLMEKARSAGQVLSEESAQALNKAAKAWGAFFNMLKVGAGESLGWMLDPERFNDPGYGMTRLGAMSQEDTARVAAGKEIMGAHRRKAEAAIPQSQKNVAAMLDNWGPMDETHGGAAKRLFGLDIQYGPQHPILDPSSPSFLDPESPRGKRVRSQIKNKELKEGLNDSRLVNTLIELLEANKKSLEKNATALDGFQATWSGSGDI